MSDRWFNVLNNIINEAKRLLNEMNELDSDIDKYTCEYIKNTNEQNCNKLQEYINIRDDSLSDIALRDITVRLIGICSMLDEL